MERLPLAKLSVQEILSMSEHQFGLQAPMNSLWQLIADHFYPERADFTVRRNVGQEFADHLMDSYPLLVRRDLGDSLAAMLRDGEWFNMGVDDTPDYMGTDWLQTSTRKLRKLMYRREANFIKASKQGDHDFVTFGQCVKSVEMNKNKDGLLYRCWHLRDCAWWEDESGQVGGVVRKWDATKRDLVNYFGEDAVHPAVLKNLIEKPFDEVPCLHMVIPSEMYGDDELASRYPFVSLYIDKRHQHLVQELGLNHKHYVIPRFHTIAGAPYAYSPATTVGLSDARTLQAMTHTLMEAAERYARPPIIATAKVVRGDVDLSADGITWVDDAYDERMGAALRTIPQDRGGWPIGDAERSRINETLNSAFYLSKLTLPEAGTNMTATEVIERMKQYRRENLPLFSPIEAEDNGQICELSFQIAMSNGLLGSPYDIPISLRGSDVEFKFESPLTVSENEQIAARYQQTTAMIGEAIALDPSVGADVNLSEALRSAVTGIGAPVTWLTSPEQKQTIQLQQAAQREAVARAGT